MKRLLLILIFTISLQTLIKADDINDFEIEGMSIGDRLTDYFEKEIIDNHKKSFYPSSEKFYLITISREYNLYEYVTFHIKNDGSYIIAAIKGYVDYPNDINNCKKQKNKITNSIKLNLNKVNEDSYDSPYETLDDGKSIAYVTDFKVNGGWIRVWCENWSTLTENNRSWIDGLAVSASSNEQDIWINEEAY